MQGALRLLQASILLCFKNADVQPNLGFDTEGGREYMSSADVATAGGSQART